MLVLIHFLKSFHILGAWVNHDKLHICHERLLVIEFESCFQCIEPSLTHRTGSSVP
jgi:hypothetical protein